MMLKTFYAAIEALSSAIPIALGGLVWIAFKIGPEMVAPLVLAMFCAMTVTNLSGLFSQRPLIYHTRFFEVSVLVGFIDSVVPQLGSWGLVDTPAVRLTLVVMACLGAALLQPVFYSFRLQRLTRFIPAPVFAGFLNAVALILILSQGRQILALFAGQGDQLWPALLVAAVCFAVAYAARRLNPKLPAGMVGLAAASVLAFVLAQRGHQTPSIMSSDLHWVLPIALLDWGVFDTSKVALGALLLHTAATSALLAVVIFLSTITVAETASQVDDKPLPSLGQNLLVSAGKIISACLGSLPMSGSPSPTLAALRTGGLTPWVLLVFSMLALLFYALGFLAWTPSSAIIGLLLFVALELVDRPSAALAWRYFFHQRARASLSVMQREDLLTVALVTLVGAAVNMVAALLVGMALGLVLFAKRNGKSPIKDVHDGRSWRSNCARSSGDTALLVQHGERILSLRLQGALYFGVARSLRAKLEDLLPQRSEPQWLVLDWRAVVSCDTTLDQMLERFEQGLVQRGVRVLHCARAGFDKAYADVDRALEVCENQLLDELRPRVEGHDSNTSHLNALLGGLGPSVLALVLGCFERRDYAAGKHVLTQGEQTRDLHVISSGRADVLIQGGTIRLVGVNSGAILGEMGFLDGTPRSADVVATEPLVSHVLSRERFEKLSQQHPEVAQHLLQNLCKELANRLRYLHQLISRERT